MTYTAKEGYVWQNKTTKMIMGEEIAIGFIFPNGVKTQDTIENYEQVVKPKERNFEGRLRYDKINK